LSYKTTSAQEIKQKTDYLGVEKWEEHSPRVRPRYYVHSLQFLVEFITVELLLDGGAVGGEKLET